jgi:hypothetical protein
MTDYQKIKQTLDSAGIRYHEAETTTGKIISINACEGPKNAGYDGLSTTFQFTHSGALDSVGVWEDMANSGVA